MAKKNTVIKGKVKAKKASLGSGYAGNVLRSLGYSARDVITDIMPNTTSVVNDARSAKLELDEALSMAAKKSKELSASAKSKLAELKENDLKDLVEDLKSGNIYNKNREKNNDIFGNFGMDDFGDFDDFDEDFDIGTSSSTNANVTMDLDIPEDSPIVISQDMTTAAVSKSANIIAKENRANSLAIASSVVKMSSSLTSGMQLLHSEIAKISTVVPKTLTEHAALSAKYYEDSISYQKKISESLDELKTLYVNSQKLASGSNSGYRESKLDKFLGLDLGGYKNLVKSQAKSTIMDNPIIGMLPMVVDMARNGMLTGGKSAGQTGLNLVVKTLMGKGIKKSLGKVDSFLENLLLPVGMKIGKWQDDWSSPLKQFIGNVFGIKAAPDLSVDKSKYEKGAVAFDGKVHRAITDVIPTYLRMITSALTGKEEIAFDYEKGVYNTVSNIRKNFEKDIKSSVTNTYFSEKFDFDRIVDKLEGVSKKQNAEIKGAFEDFLFNMAKTNDLVSFRKNGDKDDIAKLLGRSSDDPVVRIIREYFEGLYNQGRHSDLNEIFGSKALSAKRNLESTMQKMMKDSTTSNYHLIDNGLYSSDNTFVNTVNPEQKQLEDIVKRYGKDKGKGKLAYERLQEIKQTANKGSKSSTIQLANTGNGLGLDKYNRTNGSYLRDILSTLATGIKVVNVGTIDGGADAIVRHSKKILNSLNLDDSLVRSTENAKDGSSPNAGAISYNAEKTIEAISSILSDGEDSNDIIDKIANKFGDWNALGRIASSIRDKRNKFNKKADDIATKITGAGIDAIYGKRESDQEESDTETGPSTGIVSGPPSTAVDNQLIRQYSKISSAFINQIVEPIKNAFFNKDDGFITQLEEADIVNTEEDQTKEATKNLGKKVAQKTKNGIVGELNEETGEYEHGLLSAEASAAAVAKTNMTKWSHDLIYGSEDGKQKGLMDSVRSFFGETEDGKLNISGKAADAGKTLKEHLIRRSYEWSDLIFGKSEEGEDKKLDIFLGDMKGKKGEIAGAAAVGVLGSFFLPGGPITGALIGAGMDIVKNSTQLKNVLFGEQDENGERTGAIITKETQDFFKKNGKAMKIGAGAGVLGSFFLPGGPITGALIGAGVGLATKSEAFSNLLYGEGGTKEDPTGGITKYIKDHYSKNKDVKASFLDAGIGAGVGIMGSFFLPGGPITGALIGAGASMALNSDRFKDWFFGKEDPEDDNKRKGGVFGEVRDKLTEKVRGMQDNLSIWISENITNPLKASMEPIKKRAKNFLFGDDEDAENKGLVGAIASRVDKSAFGDLKRAVKENIIDKMKNGFKQLFGAFGHLIGTILKSPVTAIQAVAEGSDPTEEGKASLAKRISELNAESRKKMEERKANRKIGGIKKTAKGQAQEESSSAKEAESVEAEEQTAENTKETAQATANAEKIVQEQLDNSKEEHSEKMGILQKILDRIPFKKSGPDVENTTTSATATSGSSFTGPTLVERIDRNVDKISKSVDGQLNGVGYNINRIYKLLRKKLKTGDDDDDDGDDDIGGDNKKHHSFLDRFRSLKPRNGVKAITGFVKKTVFGVVDGVRGAFGKAVGGFVKIGKAIFSIPKMLLNAAKAAIPKIGKGLLEVAKLGGSLLKNAIHGLGNVIEEGSKGLGHLIAGAFKGFGSLMQGLGIFGKEALTLISKGVGGIAKLGASALGSAAGAIANKFGKNKANKTTRFVIDGGHLDYVSYVGQIGSSGVSPDTGTASNVINFPGVAEIGEGSQAAAFQGGMSFGSMKNAVRGKLSALSARAKGSIGAIKARFAKEDSEKEQRSWRDKIVSLLQRNTDDNKKHHSVWNSIFSKKGLITAGLILAAPLIIKAVKGIIGFFSSGVGKSLLEFLSKGLDWFKKAFDDEGGLSGVVNNAAENVGQVSSGLGLTNGQQYMIDNNGAIVSDENGNLVKVDQEKKFSLKNMFFGKKAHIDPETGKVTNEETYDHTTQMLGKAAKLGTHKGVRVIGGAIEGGKWVAGKAKAIASSKAGKWVADKAETAAIHGMYAMDKVVDVAKNSNVAKKVAGAKNAGLNAAKSAGSAIKNSNVVKKVANTKVVGTAVEKGKGIISTAKKFLKKAISFVTEKFGGLAKKFGGSKGAIGKITQKIGKLTSGLWDDTLIKKFSPTIQKLLAKMGISTGSALLAEVAFVSIGALGGALNPGELFEVNMDDIQNGKTKALMVAISTVYKGIMGSSLASWFDLACDMLYEVTGFNLAKLIATGVLDILASDETSADLAQAQEKFDERYEDAVLKEYEAWKKNQEESGQATMSFDEFKASDLAMSRSDFNLETNKTLGKRIFDAGKKFAGAASKTVGKAVSTFLPHRENVYKAADGTYYRKSTEGSGYDYFSPLGVLLKTGVTEEEVVELVKSGQLVESKKWVTSERFQKMQELGAVAANTFKAGWEKVTSGFNSIKEKLLEAKDYVTENVSKYGVFGAAMKFISKKKKQGWYDANGGYYVLNDDGTAYNYYNLNGDLVSENVDKEEVEDMKVRGLLTEGEVVEDSDAQVALKTIKEKAGEFWKNAKTATSGALEKMASFFGFGKKDDTPTTPSSAVAITTQEALNNLNLYNRAPSTTSGVMDLNNIVANSGKGSDKQETTSSSGTVNGFAYYSQNDPRFKNQAYNLSDGSGGTMGERGCGPAAMSMVTSQLTGKDIDPVVMANMATKGGYSIDAGTTPEYFQNVASSMGISSANVAISKESIRKALSNGTPMILQGAGTDPNSPFTSDGHYVVGVGLNGDNVIVNDPRGKAYSREYNIDDIIPNMQNAWAFSNGSLKNTGSYNGLTIGGSNDKDSKRHLGRDIVVPQTGTQETQKRNLGRRMELTSSQVAQKLREQVVNAIRSREGQNEYTQGNQRTNVGSGYGDCSATTQWALKTGANIDPGGYSGAQYTNPAGFDVDNTSGGPNESNLLPGDLLFYRRNGSSYADGVGHVEMYVGDGKRMGHGSNLGPKESSLSSNGKDFLKARRFITDDASDFNAPNLDPANTTGTASASAYSDTGLSEGQIEQAGGTSSDGESSGGKSILELLTGAASAFAKPIMEWITGKKSEDSGDTTTTPESYKFGTSMQQTGSMTNGDSGIAADPNVTESQVSDRMMQYYTNLGYSKPAIFAMMGNAYAESKLNPAIIQGNGKGPAAGLFQWENYNNKSGRWKAMADHAASKNKDWTSLDPQLEFAHMEMKDPGSVFWSGKKGMENAGTVPTTYEDWKNSTNVETATRQFEGAFERAGKPHMDTRIAAAKRYYDLYQDWEPKRNLGNRREAPSDPNLVQAAGKGGGVVNISDSPRSSKLDTAASRHHETKIRLEESTDPLRRVAIELLTRIANNTEGINDGVRDLFNKDTPTSTQIIDGRTHNNIIPVPQKEKESLKDTTQYSTAKQISAGIYLT